METCCLWRMEEDDPVGDLVTFQVHVNHRVTVMNGVYDPGAQKRGLGWRYKLGSHQHLLLTEAMAEPSEDV